MAFEKFIVPHSAVLDIGANMGIYAKLFSHFAKGNVDVYAIEPIPETYHILANNIQKANLRNIFPFELALSDHAGLSDMVIPSYKERHGISLDGKVYAGDGLNYYSASLERDGLEKAKKVQVRLSTIDEFVRQHNIQNISLIKCDVEGHELAVVSGGKETIGRFKPVLYIEVSSDPRVKDSSGSALFSLLSTLGYSPFFFSEEAKDIRIWDNSREPETNFFFLPS